MKQLHLYIDDETDKVLDTYPHSKSDIVREALAMYIEGTRTDTFKKLRVSFGNQAKEMAELGDKLDKLNSRLDEMTNRW